MLHCFLFNIGEIDLENLTILLKVIIRLVIKLSSSEIECVVFPQMMQLNHWFIESLHFLSSEKLNHHC